MEKYNFDFSNQEDQKKFEKIKSEDKCAIIEDSHKEGLLMHNKQFIKEEGCNDLLSENAKKLPEEFQQSILEATNFFKKDWQQYIVEYKESSRLDESESGRLKKFEGFDNNNLEINKLVQNRLNIEIELFAKLFSLVQNNKDFFEALRNKNNNFYAKLEAEKIYVSHNSIIASELERIMRFIEICKNNPEKFKDAIKSDILSLFLGYEDDKNDLVMFDKSAKEFLYIRALQPFIRLFKEIIKNNIDICYVAPTSAIPGAVVAKKATDEFHKIDETSPDTYFSYPSLKPPTGDYDYKNVEILYNDYYKKGVEIGPESKETRRKLKLPDWVSSESFNYEQNKVKIFGTIIDEFKRVLLKKLEGNKNGLKVMIFDESRVEGRTMNSYKEIVRVAWANCISEGTIPEDCKLEIIEGPCVAGSERPYWSKILTTEYDESNKANKITRISRGQYPESRKVTDIAMEAANILGTYIAHRHKNVVEINGLIKSK